MPSIETKIMQAIQGRIATLNLGYSVLWTNDGPQDKPTGGGKLLPYIEAHFEPNRTVRVLIGGRGPHERPSILLLTLCWPITEIGSAPGKTHRNTVLEIAGQIAEHFPCGGACMSFRGTGVSVMSAPSVRGAYLDDAYMRTPIEIMLRATG